MAHDRHAPGPAQPRTPRPVIALIAAAVCASPAAAQFGIPLQTTIVQVLEGRLLVSDGEPAIAPGDQLAAVFDGAVSGVYTFTVSQAEPDTFSFSVFGDDPATPEIEGPAPGEVITFQFFDESRSVFRTDLAAINADGETANFVYGGVDTFDPFDELGFDLPGLPDGPIVPPTAIDVQVGASVAPPGDGDPGSPDTPGTPGTPSPATPAPSGPTGDVNNDGRIDALDASFVLRAVLGGSAAAGAVSVTSLDINGDGTVNTSDAVAILRLRGGSGG